MVSIARIRLKCQNISRSRVKTLPLWDRYKFFSEICSKESTNLLDQRIRERIVNSILTSMLLLHPWAHCVRDCCQFMIAGIKDI